MSLRFVAQNLRRGSGGGEEEENENEGKTSSSIQMTSTDVATSPMSSAIVQPAEQDDLDEPPSASLPSESPARSPVCGRFGLVAFPLLVAIVYLSSKDDVQVSQSSEPPLEDKREVNDPFVVVGEDEADDGVDSYNVVCEFGAHSFRALYDMDVNWTCLDLTRPQPSEQARRCFYTYVPPECASQPWPLPVVIDLHADTTCPQSHMPHTNWRAVAEEECIVMVWPVGTVEKSLSEYSCWNVPGGRTFHVNASLEDDETNTAEPTGTTQTASSCCCAPPAAAQDPNEAEESPPQESTIDDTKVLRFMIDVLIDDFNTTHHRNKGAPQIDPTRIYITGHSNGCLAALGMAALHSDVVAAVCCHAGQLVTAHDMDGSIYGVNRTDASVLYTPTPTWLAHGTRDPVFPYQGGHGAFLSRDYLPSVPAAFEQIADANGCAPEVIRQDIIPPNGGPAGTEPAILLRRTNCTNGADVELMRLLAGHSPYVTWMDTTKLAWEFCSKHTSLAKQKRP